MEEELSLDNILTDSDVDNLFVEETLETPPEKEKETKEETTEVEVENLFESEGVGSEEETKEKEDAPGTAETPSNLFSSIALAFVDEGIFPDLDSDKIKKVSSAEDFRELVEERIKSELDERQKRIDEALNLGIEPNVVKQYENTIQYLDNIKDTDIADETERGIQLRKQLIMRDYLNRGYSQERATKAMEKSFKNGDDIEDAKEALLGNKEFFKSQYENVIKEAKEEEEREIKERNQRAENLKKSILSDKKFFGELEVDKATRQKIYDNIAKPVFKDKDGRAYTAIQKYEMENSDEFLKNLGLVFTLTNGFKDFNSLVKGKVNKEVKKGFKDLERVLNNTQRNSNGSLKFTSGVDSESYINSGWKLDI